MPKVLAPETYADREARRQHWAEKEEERKRRNREKLAPLVENPPRIGRPPVRLKDRH